LKKFNLLTESRYNFSVSSLSFTPPGSAPSSPGHLTTAPSQRMPLPPSPLLGSGIIANKSVTVHSLNSENSTLSQALPVMGNISDEHNKTLLEESSDDVITETSTSITSAETKPELITTTIATDVIPTPVVMVTEATESASTSCSPKGDDATFSDFAKKSTIAISPICGDPAAETKDNSNPTVSSDDPAQIKILIRDESTNPIAVCLSIQDAEAGDIYKEFTDKQIMDLPEKASETQSSPHLEEETSPLGCVKEIRDLVMEVIEVEEVIQTCKDNGENVQKFEEPEAIV